MDPTTYINIMIVLSIALYYRILNFDLQYKHMGVCGWQHTWYFSISHVRYVQNPYISSVGHMIAIKCKDQWLNVCTRECWRSHKGLGESLLSNLLAFLLAAKLNKLRCCCTYSTQLRIDECVAAAITQWLAFNVTRAKHSQKYTQWTCDISQNRHSTMVISI